MNSKRISVLLATAMALLALSGAANAAERCGAYGFSAQGHLIGLLDSGGASIRLSRISYSTTLRL
ncbi:hypothetical protein P0D72_03545 [Paraburkholderia sediminicola]|uniref:hypothetical protein n=1 Tax=Paraburkholderia sediminicola TaxID=458836 RepID=UPI0038BD18CF